MQNDNNSNDLLFSNNFVKCYSDHLDIDLYYFPYGNKKVKYSDIQSCELIPMSEMPFYKIKMWGMALSSIWWHSDLHRLGRESCIILDTNHWPKIGLTMDDHDIPIVYKLIKERINPNGSFLDIKKQEDHYSQSKSEKNFDYHKIE